MLKTYFLGVDRKFFDHTFPKKYGFLTNYEKIEKITKTINQLIPKPLPLREGQKSFKTLNHQHNSIMLIS